MRLYHYAPIQNSILKDGLGSFEKGYGDIAPYLERAGSSKRAEITLWMEKTFKGRSRALSVITEPIKWNGNDPMLKEFVKNHMLFSFELNDLRKAGLIESIWCQDGDTPYPILPTEIDLSPLSWEKSSREKGLFFGVIRHYFIVIKDGVLPPKYIRQEKSEIHLDKV